MKQCSKCKKEKKLTLFGKNNSVNDGFDFYCIVCRREQKTFFRRTKKGLISKIYNDQKAHSRMRGHNMPTYTLEQLREWVYKQPNFNKLYDKWVESGYHRRNTPSIDRADNSTGYTLNNLFGVCTALENTQRYQQGVLNGVEKTRYIKVVKQFTKDGVFIRKFHSINEAQRITGVGQGCISRLLINRSGGRKTAGGYKWALA